MLNCATPTQVLLLWFGPLRLSAESSSDCVDILCAKTHVIHLAIDRNVGPARLQHLFCCGLDVHGQQPFLRFLVIEGMYPAVLHILLLFIIRCELASIHQVP